MVTGGAGKARGLRNWPERQFTRRDTTAFSAEPAILNLHRKQDRSNNTASSTSQLFPPTISSTTFYTDASYTSNMAATRKRKHAVAEEQQTSKQTPNAKNQKNINTFGTVSKAHVADGDLKKRKLAHTREPTPPAITLTAPTPGKADWKRKRKLEAVAEESDGDDIAVSQSKAPTDIFKQFARKDASGTPRQKRFKNALPPSPAETPTKHPAALFDKLKLDSAISFSLGKGAAPYDTPPETPDAEKQMQDLPFPVELEDLCQLHAAFLTALSLHYSHNGTSSPVSLNTLLPQITKTWGKRTVMADDVRRLLAVEHTEQGFAIEYFGSRGMCLVRLQPRGHTVKRAASYIEEETLRDQFEAALQQKWAKWQASAEKENSSAALFISQLSLSPITTNESVEKTAPLFARGQQRLADLKAGQAAAQNEASKPTT
jgi:hypothetical protein